MKMVMPKMGMTMEEGTIVEWKRKDGEYVKKGEIILEIMTNKVNIDVEAPASGYLKVLKFPDDVVPVGEVVALIEESVEAVEAGKKVEVPPVDVPVVTPAPGIEPETAESEIAVAESRLRIPASPRARRLAEEKGVRLEDVTGTGPGGAVTESDILSKVEEKKPVGVPASEPGSSSPAAVSPLAEKIAREKGVDLSRVKGTGLGGKITKEDVLRHVEAAKPAVRREVEAEVREAPEVYEKPRIEAEPAVTEPEVQPVEKPAEVPEAVREEIPEAVPEKVPKAEKVPTEVPAEGIPLTGIRKLTAERMSKSKREVPHLTLGMGVDMNEASKLKDSLNVSYTDILVRATALALRKYPIMNSTLTGNRITLRDNVNIGIAVARGEDLLVPVIHDADKHSLKEIARITRDLVERTRKDQLTEKDVLDGTFTISNLGMYGIDFFTPIINPPEAAILGVGEIKKKPVVINDDIQIREQVTLSLSFDHRIVNGMPASLFLMEMKNLLEHPYKLFVEGES